MSALDTSSLLTPRAPETLAPPVPPATPEIDTSPTAGQQVEAGLLTPWVDTHESADEQAAAALVDLSGASSFMVDEYEVSLPPNLAAASALLDEVASANSVSAAAMGSLYTLMDSSAALALTSY